MKAREGVLACPAFICWICIWAHLSVFWHSTVSSRLTEIEAKCEIIEIGIRDSYGNSGMLSAMCACACMRVCVQGNARVCTLSLHTLPLSPKPSVVLLTGPDHNPSWTFKSCSGSDLLQVCVRLQLPARVLRSACWTCRIALETPSLRTFPMLD